MFDPVLQTKLDALWFALPASTPASQQAERQAMLVREFQLCAKGRFGAQDAQATGSPDASRLSQVELHRIDPSAKLRDDFPPHGRPDAETLSAIQAWLAPTARLRSPLVFQARDKGTPARPWQTISQQAFWFHDELATTKARVFVMDFTGRVAVQNGKPAAVVVGTAVHKHDAPANRVIGSASGPAHSLVPFNPENVIGRRWDALSAAEQSIFRVVAALAYVETSGIVDGINAWDTSVLSAGPYHYTGFPAGAIGAAELGAFLAYFASIAPRDHDTLFGQMGLAATSSWSAALFQMTDRTYRAELGFSDAAGRPVAPTSVESRNWLRTWGSLYRIEHALRNSAALRAALWPFSRQRIHDLLATPWGDAGGPPGATTLGDVFRSERSVAMLLRWHVFRPAHVVEGGRAGPAPRRLVAVAKLASKAVSTWGDAEEVKLVGAFLKSHTTDLAGKVSLRLQEKLRELNSWAVPAWSGGLAGPLLRMQRSFAPDYTGIPFP